MDRIGIIQLSDIQFGSKHTFGFPSDISKKIIYDIEKLCKKNYFMPLYIIISGDITETAHGNEFDDALKELKNISQGLSIDDDSILSVPGNHDINWELSKIAAIIGDPLLKYNNYNKFTALIAENCSSFDKKMYPVTIDHRAGLIFLLLNSCENEDNVCHIGYVDSSKVIESIKYIKNDFKDMANYVKIAVLHHRLDTTISDDRAAIENALDIEAILLSDGFNVVLTGHVHQNIVHEVRKGNSKIIYSGTGSTGVDHTQRPDGIQNQYCIHIIDRISKTFQTIWRAYNPKTRTAFGLGGWTIDNSENEENESFSLNDIKEFVSIKGSLVEDSNLKLKYNISSNPFTFSNAEKISRRLLLNLFVSDETRHKGATRFSGDAIIRGPRGSGKTMLLRYLHILGEHQFDRALKEKKTAETFPVFVNLSQIHYSDIGNTTESIYQAADKLIYDSVIEAINKKADTCESQFFKLSVYQMNQQLKNISLQQGTLISKLGKVIQEKLLSFFNHVLILIDEVAPVFPREFFTNPEDGFLRWMNSIRSSGPYFTRVAVYPNDISDILNEERFGTMVNLGYDIRTDEDYIACREYFTNIVNNYLSTVSLDKSNPVKIEKIFETIDTDSYDSLEQLIYASDGSSRRFLSLIDKCLGYAVSNNCSLLKKEDLYNVIKEFCINLLSGYNQNEQELAKSIAKACKKQVTFRFRLPGLSGAVNPLYSKREELNIVKLSEVGTGRRGSTYEFTYPYCILMEIHTHNIKDTRKICTSRDRIIGEWISQVTTIVKENLDFFNSNERYEGYISEIDNDITIIKSTDGKEYLGEEFIDGCNINDKVSFIVNGTQALGIQCI